MVLDGSHCQAKAAGRGSDHREQCLPVLNVGGGLSGGQLALAGRRGEELAERLEAEDTVAQRRLMHDFPGSCLPLPGVRVDRVEQDVGIEADPLSAHATRPVRGLGHRGDDFG